MLIFPNKYKLLTKMLMIGTVGLWNSVSPQTLLNTLVTKIQVLIKVQSV